VKSKRSRNTLTADTSELDGLAALLKDRWEEGLQPAAEAGAEVILQRLRRNVEALGRKTGRLRESLYKVLSRDNSGPYRATYHMSWNYKKAPHGSLVENGHWQRYAMFKDAQGRWRMQINMSFARTEGGQMRPWPKRNDSQDYKNSYFVPLAQPIWIKGEKFVASAVEDLPKAVDIVRRKMVEILNGGNK
jgi:hypothetical protein